ncbi:nitrogen regulation protein NR(II) [Actinoplanes sp. NPDC049599]|uniref:nitrogen regulation protein NR(II) n=1 Tax=Actinoplanes sp. NPDC049599 TaxID=3363903 RepID=UPI0037A6D0B6
MTSRAWWVQRWLRGTDTMLGQVRTLFLGILLVWPGFGLWGLIGGARHGLGVPAVVAALLVVAWLYLGYRRQRFPAWSWIPEGACVCVVAAASDYGITIGLLFVWVNFRSLYGRLRQKLLAAAVLCVIMAVGIMLGVAPGAALPLLFTALISVAVNHVLARGSSARDRSADREATLASAGAGLVASMSRAEAMDVTLGAALSLDRASSAALVLTVTRQSLHVIAAAGNVGSEAAGWITELARLPAGTDAALRPGEYVAVGDEAAREVTELLRLPPHPMVMLAPLAAHGHAFGMLVLALDRRPADDLSAALTTLADEAALTLDQLLSRSRLSIVVEHSADALILAGENGVIRFVNPAAEMLLACPGEMLTGHDLWSLVHEDEVSVLRDVASSFVRPKPVPCRIRGSESAEWADVEALVEYVSEHDGSRSIVFTARDVSERHRLELELRHAQKLESVGRLAAGIAHEINTPIQFVGDNVRFLDTAFADLDRLLAAYRELVSAAQANGDLTAALRNLDGVATEIDIDFVMEEVPAAVTQTLEGIGRVAHIVRAMKAFGHPGTEEKSRADLNEAIQNTVVVANNEIKYIADVETDLGELPLVHCHLGDINQVVLNLVVNAAHAIGAADRGRGTIRISTRLDDGYAVIEVADTGTGVPPEIADKLFDPFFTTKEVGTGTGQGLALVRTLVADRHGGTIDFTSTVGAGTVFTVRLPVGELGEMPDTRLAEASR